MFFVYFTVSVDDLSNLFNFLNIPVNISIRNLKSRGSICIKITDLDFNFKGFSSEWIYRITAELLKRRKLSLKYTNKDSWLLNNQFMP